jgi:nucleotide-binding universal stress UspA family protein
MKVLIATDGSRFSDAAIQSVATQFRAEATEVRVLQVVEPFVFTTPPEMSPGYAPEMAARFQEQLKLAKDSLARAKEVLQKAGFKVDSQVIENEVRTGILSASDDWRSDLIVLGSHGQKGLRKFLLGSVAEFVARHARCSVLIVRKPSE